MQIEHVAGIRLAPRRTPQKQRQLSIRVGLFSQVVIDAQRKAMKKIAGSLRLDLAAYRELEAFAQLGTELDAATQRQLDRGAQMVELLKQAQYAPFRLSEQVISIFAGTKGYLDSLAINQVREFEKALLKHMNDEFPEIGKEIMDKGELSDELQKKLGKIIEDFKSHWAAKSGR